MKQSDIVFLSHGGGPLPLLGDPDHEALAQYLTTLGQSLKRPDAIVVFSAHWESQDVRITAQSSPELLYDYSGFPAETYQIQYPSSGAPDLAKQVSAELSKAGIANQLEHERGFDHGVFVPLKLMFPQADVPVIQVSLLHSLDAAKHIAIGKALQPLLEQNLLFIGSGFSFHNMRAFFSSLSHQDEEKNLAFEDWLKDVCTDESLNESQRESILANWQDAPYARFCHPREEHLLPLHVCYGLAGRAADSHESVKVLGKQAGMFHWLSSR
ncbi:dioxygenase [Bermanella marisrubri]|uniref:LigB family enzyme n=1 Tax=Bermanella marisrubri TaxID=207949 RepID=Q1MY81_9GAMM|nr:class III extradiol ring-cleavage dioxygenase [Bermanella marisrubri]EAT10929.1 LigB family enzyme [Oceanobacter sp. RED65] [Bermanella marisrubri]QIZ83728.1 dioxygenase [Bermanella marisrubri]